MYKVTNTFLSHRCQKTSSPAESTAEVSSIYAGAIWLGGWEFDEFGQPANLKMAAQTYRSSARNDFWAGPLDANGGTDEAICNQWDEHFEVEGDRIIEHIVPLTIGIISTAAGSIFTGGFNVIGFESATQPSLSVTRKT